MKAFDVDVKSRLSLANLLGAQEGNLQTLRTYQRIMDAVDLTAGERKAIGLRSEGNTLLWDAEASAAKTVELEDEQARALVGLLNSWQRFTPSDLAWVEPIIKAL